MSEKKRGIIILVVLGLVVVLGSVFFIGWRAGGSKPAGNTGSTGGTAAGQSTAAQTTTATPDPIPVTFSDIFESEESRAFYNGKAVEVKGSVDDFFGASYPDIYFRMRDDSVEGVVKCHFTDPAEIAKVAELHLNDNVIVTGKWGKVNSFGGLQNCSVRLADGKEIELTAVPPIQDGVCVLTVEEFLALDFARNEIRAEALLGDAKVQITAEVRTQYRTNRLLIRDDFFVYIGTTKEQQIRCVTNYDDYMDVSGGDIVVAIGAPSKNTAGDLWCYSVTRENSP